MTWNNGRSCSGVGGGRCEDFWTVCKSNITGWLKSQFAVSSAVVSVLRKVKWTPGEFICRFIFTCFLVIPAGESVLNCSRDKRKDLQMFHMGWASIKILPRQGKALQEQWKGSHQRHSLRIKMSRISHFNRHLLRMAWCLSCLFSF